MIELKNVSKTFNRDKLQIEALRNVSIKVNKGDIYGVIGFSGAGKSTLIRMVNYLETPTQGDVIVNDQNLKDLSTKDLRELRKKIGMIFQHFNLLESKTIFDNIAIPLILNKASKEEINDRVTELLKFVGLENRADAYPSELSGGELQRFCVVRALSQETKFLIADEMTTMLDAITQAQIWNVVLEHVKKYNIGLIVISHEKALVNRICDRIVDLTEFKELSSNIE